MEVLLTKKPLSLDAIYRAVQSPDFGGIVLFCGNVRGSEGGAKIQAIDYEAYESMAVKKLNAAASALEDEFQARIAIHHRLGSVPVGESSVLVAAAAAHRAEAFAACRAAIDRLKSTVPIWKIKFAPVPAEF